jgi:ribosomal subunit interface protein
MTGREEGSMDLILKGRGLRLTEPMRRAVEQKLRKLERVDPRTDRLEVEITREPTPRIDGGHRVQVSAQSAGHVFRAEGTGSAIDGALDQVVQRLERQMTSYWDKLRGHR